VTAAFEFACPAAGRTSRPHRLPCARPDVSAGLGGRSRALDPPRTRAWIAPLFRAARLVKNAIRGAQGHPRDRDALMARGSLRSPRSRPRVMASRSVPLRGKSMSMAMTSLGSARSLGFPLSQWVFRVSLTAPIKGGGRGRTAPTPMPSVFGKSGPSYRVRAECRERLSVRRRRPRGLPQFWHPQNPDGLGRPRRVEPRTIGTCLFQTDTTRYREISYRDNCQQSQQHGRLLPHCCHWAVELIVSVVIRSQRLGIALRTRCLSFPSGVETVC
jgi:hypothetical protein